ncbi:MAG: SpoIIE family protein phosphatase [Chloroflexi bacterium]|nr:SpoIIE family protein phosphatase [Chloroflexota bacterium]MXX99961.1 SpoIIE family protein phosphatase [Chloroflexota bacterium]MYB15863.1 SpoIIE family protein phosphatase [Chloroflexota bacterium]MYC47456.1 SpoIIE family protein phosphatase [Chloroflexota bacterium]
MPPDRPRRRSRTRYEGPTRKILVVDDEPDLEPLILQRMRRQIRSGQYEFQFAGNGVEAVALLEQDKEIELVLSDINMPRMDGLTLLQQIPQITDDIRSVIISAYGDMDNIRTAMNRGAFDFVTKPVDFKDLDITIERALNNLAEWRNALAARDQLVSLQRELDIARRLQESILPKSFPKSDDFEISGFMQAARNVGGDFYDFLELPNGNVGLVIADVSDKGVSAAMFMMSARTTIKGAALDGCDAAEVLTRANDLLSADNPNMMFVTAFYAEYEPASGTLTYANGGHDLPVLVDRDGARTIPSTGGVALGVLPGMPYSAESIKMQVGDTFVAYTDGVTDAMSPQEEQFGLGRLMQLFAEKPPSHAGATVNDVVAAVKRFAAEQDQFDDITCLVLQRLAPGSRL